MKKTGAFNRRKRFWKKSIGKRSPGYFIQQAKYRFYSNRWNSERDKYMDM
ncbi:hypothetical protein GCM10020331_084720 [Ectobacillus funiculus]